MDLQKILDPDMINTCLIPYPQQDVHMHTVA